MVAQRPIVILGPTAGGKSELAVSLAEHCNGEILGADSMQVYRHMNAGTAKPAPALRHRAAHHLIDIVEPTERFTVADWVQQADALIDRLRGDGKTPIVVGGTNLYIKALLEGMFDGPPHDAKLRSELAALPTTSLHQRLTQVDVRAAERIHPNDRKRLVRALEVYYLTGQPISHLQTQWRHQSPTQTAADSDSGHMPASASMPEDSKVHRGNQRARQDGETGATQSNALAQTPSIPCYRHDPVLIGLSWPVKLLNRRINQRVRAMFYPEKVTATFRQKLNITEGLPSEVERLHQSGLLGQQSSEAIGYKQVIDFIHGRCSLADAFEQTKILTRRLAKQQRTWLRRFRCVHWFKAGDGLGVQILADVIDVLKL